MVRQVIDCGTHRDPWNLQTLRVCSTDEATQRPRPSLKLDFMVSIVLCTAFEGFLKPSPSPRLKRTHASGRTNDTNTVRWTVLSSGWSNVTG